MDNTIGNRILKGTVIVLLVGIAAKLASFLYETVLAYYIGTSDHGDAYHLISGVQAAIYPMLSIGIWKVFMPLYKNHLANEEYDEATSIANKSITFFTLVSLAAVVLLIVFARAVVSVIAPGLATDVRELCIRLVRISAPMYAFILAASVVAAMLQSHQKFFASQIREVVSHIPPILTAIILYRRLGPDRGVEALAISLVVAAALRLIIELPFVNWGFKYKPDFKLNTSEFKLMLSRMPSSLISAGLVQINAVVDKSMASMLHITGTIAGLNYGSKLLNVFGGLLSTPIATALYPQMIELISLKKKDELSSLTAKIINIFIVLMIPVSVACWFFRQELVAAVYQRGVFDAASTALTRDVFGFYSIGIFFTACCHVLDNIFYGSGDTRTPMIISVISLVANIVLNLILIRFLQAGGLALSTSLAAMLVFVLRLFFARKHVVLKHKAMLVTAAKVLAASLAACLIPRFLFGDASLVGTEYADRISHAFYLNRYLLLVLSAAIGVPVYVALIKLMRVTELKDMLDILLKKLRKKKPAS